MNDAILFNIFLFLCCAGIFGYIATYKTAGEDANFKPWFAHHLWQKGKE